MGYKLVSLQETVEDKFGIGRVWHLWMERRDRASIRSSCSTQSGLKHVIVRAIGLTEAIFIADEGRDGMREVLQILDERVRIDHWKNERKKEGKTTHLPQPFDENICNLLSELNFRIHLSKSRYKMLHEKL